ncbi:beta-glucoside-specific PTS transporter subunit IIABC [Leuconostoc citreum]|jgi:PTS system beta-glucosides-specific IIC component|uniref:beta-glucoside-specific PTS transporter subunit IIABC n=1 Tax=Leuconostoc citreum TaxID=33964 RepID=UPI000512E842|nr:beta-glucoside-specific PTS transporter subunit IIABC [Leuconostoc citreum]KAF0261212.1 PTS beta-glucoside transporter subunit EIIBCA [Leuconostoc citreum]MCJ2168050.1 beta-glucoside-specific PTS transporter subunit IIABC [Leuconostoc citreum]MCT3058950.1 PTS beta-glucoside transporter subunit EIIBCA [Leuconostoc citreum]MCT3071210.1 PTS beta-glucoside transporter subunit EIIBCA [Leuconostoc citreum]MCT3073109.1 PTS beta-glucoside transporter subunit EIIBCA [Leuconostoc citreum]
MAIDQNKLASDILLAVGGQANVEDLVHCSTRLRFTLRDDSIVDKEKIKSLTGVLGLAQTGGQTQVVIGNDVADTYNAVKKLLSESNNDNLTATGTKQNKKLSAIVLDFIIGIFQPLIPAIAGGGILKSFLMLANMLGLMSDTTQTYKILYFVGDAPLYFLPLLVAITTANKLKVNPLVAVSAVAALLTPNLATMLASSGGGHLFSFGIKNITYAYQVFPAILAILVYAQLEKYLTKVTPKVIRGFFVPMVSLLIVVPLTLLVLGPIGYTFGQGFAAVILFIFSKFGWIAVAILAAVLPFMVVTGMHKAMIPYVVTSLGQTGKEVIYNAASLAHNISEAGGSFAVALRTKDKGLKATALSAGISALFGITEPAIYGVTILHKRVLYGVMIGSFIGGASLGLMGVEAYVAVGPGLASLSMFISKTLPNNLLFAVIGLIISFIASFTAVAILWQDPVNQKDALLSENEAPTNRSVILPSPMAGKIIPLSSVNDAVFSNKTLGDGVAIIPSEGKLYAPTDGLIEMVYNTNHAIGMKTSEGDEILFHIGIDTVNLKGQFFDVAVTAGQQVKQGDLLVRFNREGIKAAGFDDTTMIIITNPQGASLQLSKDAKKSTKSKNHDNVKGLETV